LATAGAGSALAERSPQDRLNDSAEVFSEIMATSDSGIPRDLLDRSKCIAIVPGLKKGAFVFGAEYGRGFVSCRNEKGRWGAPAAIRVEGGSFGFQIGGSETDVVMLVMNQKGMHRLLSDQFTLGGDAAIAAGPVGRDATAQTDAEMTAEILSWSRSRGVFAGLALKGATLRQDKDCNEILYKARLDNRAVLTQTTPVPSSADSLISTLNRYSPVERGS
jgi:lipid-binding SYLF domain-containing protein